LYGDCGYKSKQDEYARFGGKNTGCGLLGKAKLSFSWEDRWGYPAIFPCQVDQFAGKISKVGISIPMDL